MFLDLGNTLGPPGAPQGPCRGAPRLPERVHEEPNYVMHVGYQFYSDFSTENEYRVKTTLEFQIRLPWGGPGASLGQGPQFSALKINLRLPDL